MLVRLLRQAHSLEPVVGLDDQLLESRKKGQKTGTKVSFVPCFLIA